LLFLPFALIPIVVSLAFGFGLPADQNQIGQLITATLLFAATRPLVRTNDRIFKTIRALVLGFAFSSLWVYKQYFINHLSRPGGVENESNYEALMLLLCLPMAFWMTKYEQSSRWRRIGLGSCLLLAGGILLTESRTGIIAGSAIGLLTALASKRKLLNIAFLAFIALAATTFGPNGLSERFHSIKFTGNAENGDEQSSRVHVELLKAGIRMMEAHPMFGIGMGRFKELAPEYNPKILQVSNRSYIAHNTFIQIGSERGIPALLLFFAMLLVTFRNFRLARLSSNMSLSALSLSMQISLIGIVIANLTVTADLLPFWLLMILSQNCRELAISEVNVNTVSALATNPRSSPDSVDTLHSNIFAHVQLHKSPRRIAVKPVSPYC